MKAGLLTVIGLGILLAMATSQAEAQLPASGFETGEPFPDLVLATLDGEPASLTQYRGKKVVLHIFASW